MGIDSRLARIERELRVRQDEGPFVLVLSACSHKGDSEYEARLQRRIRETRRQYPSDDFRLILL